MSARATRIARITPSRAESDVVPAEAEVLPARDLGEATPAAPPPGGRGRELVLHKLIEEVLTGETPEDAEQLEARASDLLATCETRTDGQDANERATTVLRTLALPQVSALRPRLVPELPVHIALSVSGEERIISGVADAVAVAADGSIEAVIDWKSDIAPSSETIAEYRSQVRTLSHGDRRPEGTDRADDSRYRAGGGDRSISTAVG